MKGKVIIVSAPSGCGKSTIINAIFNRGDVNMKFSVSATSRQPREGEKHGVNYYFLTEEEFRRRIQGDEFVEYEEVYPGRFYGTLKSEIEKKCAEGENIILDIDVKGAINVKRIYGDNALSIFIMPPSVEALRERLISRATDPIEAIEQRLSKAEYEISFANQYDVVIINDDLTQAIDETENAIKKFLSQGE